MNEQKVIAKFASIAVELGFNPPTYKKPKWYQLSLKRKLSYYDKHNWPYRIES